MMLHAFAAVLAVSFTNNIHAIDNSINAEQEVLEMLASFVVHGEPPSRRPAPGQNSGFFDDVPDPHEGDLDDVFPEDPINDPIRYDGNTPIPIPGLGSRTGTAEIVAMKVFEQTLAFFGTQAAIRKRDRSLEFIILESKRGYFDDLTALDVAFAIREFARYFKAYLCKNPSMENFAAAFNQISPERLGFRFKYDMAWALLGNPLPKEPNASFILGQKWKAVSEMMSDTDNIGRSQDMDTKELKTYLGLITDIVGFIENMNKLICFVDIRPDPKLELQKRLVIQAVLDLKLGMNKRYEEFEQILEDAKQKGIEEQRKALLEG